MALTPFTGTITAAILNANLDDKTPTLTTNAVAGRKDQNISLRVLAITNATDVSLRSIAFTPQDDLELRTLGVRTLDGTAGRTIITTVTVENGDTDFLLNTTVSVTSTTIVGTADTRVDFRATTGTRLRLLKGVRCRLTVSTTAGPVTEINTWVQLRSTRRIA